MKSLRLYSNLSSTPTLQSLSKTFNISQQIPGVDLLVQTNSKEDSSRFSSELYFSRLKAKFGSILLHGEELPSTQTLVMETKACDDFVVCVADRQTNGRGRGENTWESPLGCLMFSFRSSLPTAFGSKLPFFQYLVSLAIIRSCKTIDVKCEVNIKWPNDIYAKHSIKIGGILCQSHHDGEKFVVTTGVGLNVENEKPTTCLSSLAERKIHRELVLAEFFNSFELIYNQFLSGSEQPSFEPFLEEYLANWLHTGQRVAVDSEQRVLTIKGISPTTATLLAEDEVGNTFELTPDGNRLDFFKGLVSKLVS